MSKIALLGSTGFLGSYLANNLSEEVICIGRSTLDFSNDINESAIAKELSKYNFKFEDPFQNTDYINSLAL